MPVLKHLSTFFSQVLVKKEFLYTEILKEKLGTGLYSRMLYLGKKKEKGVVTEVCGCFYHYKRKLKFQSHIWLLDQLFALYIMAQEFNQFPLGSFFFLLLFLKRTLFLSKQRKRLIGRWILLIFPIPCARFQWFKK